MPAHAPAAKQRFEIKKAGGPAQRRDSILGNLGRQHIGSPEFRRGEDEAQQVRLFLNDVERETILERGYGVHSFAHSLVTCFERLAEQPITPALHEYIWGFAHKIASSPIELMRFKSSSARSLKQATPRATIIKRTCDKLLKKLRINDPVFEIAQELEQTALNDDYFIERKLYPNVDFYSGLIYQALGFPVAMFTVLFAIPRTVGWLAHWQELLGDKDQKISRPRQWYTGSGTREYVPLASR